MSDMTKPSPSPPPSDEPLATIKEVLKLDYIVPEGIDRGLTRRSNMSWMSFEARPTPQDSELFGFPEPKERKEMIDKACHNLYDAASGPTTHVKAMDSFFSTVARYRWCSSRISLDQIAEGVLDLLGRLPPAPMSLPGDGLQNIPHAYFHNNRFPRTWGSLKVSTWQHRNLIRIAAHRVISIAEGLPGHFAFGESLLVVGEMIEATVLHSEASQTKEAAALWSIVRGFLWSFWQSARIMYWHALQEQNMRFGSLHGEFDLKFTMRDFLVAPGLSLREHTARSATESKPDNMCAWMLEIWRSDMKCAGMDFRLLFRRYTDAFAGRPSGCRIDGGSCAGTSWRDCLRFSRAEAMDQTMHDFTEDHDSNGEERVYWDEVSYRSLTGPRAVSVTCLHDRTFKYCVASAKTMAISHVWSHGQGGRPSTGMNACLHRRYVNLALQLGCDSYWIDTACIPEEENLRSEAIGFINHIFGQSGVVLVTDRELMTLNATDPTVEDCEAILAALLFSDWNSRAWTMLEALKGRNNVRILCRGGQTLGLEDMYNFVFLHGRMDLAIACLLMPHTLRGDMGGKFESFRAQAPLAPWIQHAIKLEVVGAWMSHRPASRKLDDVKIWSLCLDPTAKLIKGPIEFWKRQESVHTGFLISSAERLSEPGLTWAPSTTFAGSRGADGAEICYRPSESLDTVVAHIYPAGLWAIWDVYHLPPEGVAPASCFSAVTRDELEKLRGLFRQPGRQLALLAPAAASFPPSKVITSHQSQLESGVLLAVCDSDCTEQSKSPWKSGEPGIRQESYRWLWRQVCQWPATVPLPGIPERKVLWIS